MKGDVLSVWISKYALTNGVQAARVRDSGDDLVRELKPDGSDGWGYFHKGEWHLERSDAVAKAEQMRLRKIVSVKKQLGRLEAMSFEILLSPDLKASQQPTVSE